MVITTSKRLISALLCLLMVVSVFFQNTLLVKADDEASRFFVSILDSEHGYMVFKNNESRTKLKSGKNKSVEFLLYPDYGYQTEYVTVYDSLGGSYNEPVKDDKVTLDITSDIKLKPVFTKKEGFEEDTYDIPVDYKRGSFISTMDYIKYRANRKLIGEGELVPIDYATVVSTVFDNRIGKNVKFDDLYTKEDNIKSLVGSGNNAVMIYEANANADYVVARVGSLLDMGVVTDFVATFNDETKAVIYDDIILDKKSGLVYIPRKRLAVDKNNELTVNTIKMQLLYIVKHQSDNPSYKHRVLFDVVGNNGFSGFANVDILSDFVSIDNIELTDKIKEVYVNDVLIPNTDWSYRDNKFSVLTALPVTTDIKVVLKDTVNASAGISLINPITAKAASYDGAYQPGTKDGVESGGGGGKYFNDIQFDKNVDEPFTLPGTFKFDSIPKADDQWNVGGGNGYRMYAGWKHADTRMLLPSKYKSPGVNTLVDYMWKSNKSAVKKLIGNESWSTAKNKIRVASGVDTLTGDILDFRGYYGNQQFIIFNEENLEDMIYPTKLFPTSNDADKITYNESFGTAILVGRGDTTNKNDHTSYGYDSLKGTTNGPFAGPDIIRGHNGGTYNGFDRDKVTVRVFYGKGGSDFKDVNMDVGDGVTRFAKTKKGNGTIGFRSGSNKVTIPKDYKLGLYCAHIQKALNAAGKNDIKYNTKYFGSEATGYSDNKGTLWTVLSVKKNPDNEHRGTAVVAVMSPDLGQAGMGLFKINWTTTPRYAYLKIKKNVKDATPDVNMQGVRFRVFTKKDASAKNRLYPEQSWNGHEWVSDTVTVIDANGNTPLLKFELTKSPMTVYISERGFSSTATERENEDVPKEILKMKAKGMVLDNKTFVEAVLKEGEHTEAHPLVANFTNKKPEGFSVKFKKVFTADAKAALTAAGITDFSGIKFNVAWTDKDDNSDDADFTTSADGTFTVTFDADSLPVNVDVSEILIPTTLANVKIVKNKGSQSFTLNAANNNETFELTKIANDVKDGEDPPGIRIHKGLVGHQFTGTSEGDIPNLSDVYFLIEGWEYAEQDTNKNKYFDHAEGGATTSYGTARANRPPDASTIFKTGDNGVMEFDPKSAWFGTYRDGENNTYTSSTWPWGTSNGGYGFRAGSYFITEVKIVDGMIKRLTPYSAFKIMKKSLPGQPLQFSKPEEHPIADYAWDSSDKINPDNKLNDFEGTEMAYINDVVRGGIEIVKYDPEWNKSAPEGDADLANTTFEVYNNSIHPVRVTEAMLNGSVGVTRGTPDNGDFFNPGSLVLRMSTVNHGGKYTTFTSQGVLPYGTYSVREVGVGTGYLLGVNNKILDETFEIRKGGQVVRFAYDEANPADTNIRKRAENEVIRGGVKVGKVDRETRKYIPLGNATLEGAIFDIYNRSANPVWVNNKEYAVGEVVATLVTKKQADGRYTDETTNQTLPYGTYEVVERQTSRGYLYDKYSKAYKKTFTIRTDNEMADLTKESANIDDHLLANNDKLAASNQVIREDWHFKKKFDDNSELQGNENNGNRMPKIAWVVTSRTTGEKHVIVTDENGMFSSSVEMHPHSHNTNANDPVQADGKSTGAKSNGAVEIRDGKYVVVDETKLDYDAGIWFTGIGPKTTGEGQFIEWAADGKSYHVGGNKVAVDDTKRAFPYDDYEVEELRSNGNKGHALVKFDVTLYRYTADHDGPGLNLDYGTIDDDVIKLKTELLQVNENAIGEPEHRNVDNNNHPNYGPSVISTKGSKTARADKDLVFLDTITFDRLNKDTNYIMRGTLHIINEDGSVSGAIAQGETRFRPSAPNGRAGVAFTGVDTSLMAGRKLVAYEELWDEDLNMLIGMHKDKADEKQIVEIFLTFETSLQYQGGKQAPPAGDVVLSDTISYNGLAKGRTYDVRGELHIVDANGNDGGLVPTMDGHEAIVRETFTAKDTVGTHTVDFRNLDLRSLNGRKVVAFQYIYFNNKQVAYHADIADVNQTVKVEGKLRINTTLNANGSKTLEKKTGVVLNDTVAYYGLDVGKSYTLKGTIHKKVNGTDGGIITAKTVTFTPQGTSGTVAVTFDSVDFTNFDGEGVVAFEELWGDGQLLATHADIHDKAQTVDFGTLPQADGFGTILTTADGSKIMKNEVMTLIDTVSYTGLLINQPYELKGTINVVDIASNTQERVIAEKTVQFTPTNPAGTEKVQFDGVDLRGLTGKKLVAFEYLYKDGKLVNSHANIDDEGQTVRPQGTTPGPFVPTLGTMLATTNGYKSTISRVVDLVDHVSYFGLDPSKDYVLRGELQLFDNNGNFKRVIASENATFRPTKPSDTFRLTFRDVDLRLENNSYVVAFENLYLGGTLVASHVDKDDKNQTVTVRNDRVPRITTNLVGDTDDEHSSVFDENSVITLTDKIFYQDLDLNRRYIVTGVLMDKKTKKPYLDADGKMVLGSTPFVPQENMGMVPVVFKFKPTKDLAGKTLVAYQTVRDIDTSSDDYYKDYEYWKSLYFSDAYWDSLSGNLWMNSKPWHDYTGISNVWYNPVNPNKDNKITKEYAAKNIVYAFHADINDSAQSIHFVELKTNAYDKKDSDKEIYPDGTQTVVDRVDVKNLTVGNTYTVSGILHERDKDGNDLGALMINNKPVSATTTFKADKPDMEVYLEFTFDASLLAGRELVAFESLYRDKKLLAVHADIKDENQSVYVPKIGTTLTDHGSHFSKASTDSVKTRVVLTDTVKYENLIEGDKYTVKGELRIRKIDSEGNVKDGGPLLIDGEPVIATKTFTAGEKYKPADNFGKKKAKKAVSAVTTASAVSVTHDTSTKAATTFNGTEAELAEIAKATSNGAVNSKAFKSKAVSGKVDVTFAFEAEDLANKSLVAYEKLFKGDKEITKHEDITDEGQTVRFPEIKTSLVDAPSLTKTVSGTTKVKLVDTVKYKNLIPGKTYTVNGTMHVKKINRDGIIYDGGVVSHESKVLTGSKTFVPDEPNGSVNVVIEGSVSEDFAGQTWVAFEELKHDGYVIAVHNDIKDSAQTVYKPKIGTTLTLSDKRTKVYNAGETHKMIDTVNYAGLTPGETYIMRGYLVDGSGNYLKDSAGALIMKEEKFRPITASGQIEIHFNGVNTTGKDKIVAYEELFTVNKILIASHRDLNDASQTVTSKVKPKTPERPYNPPSTPNNPPERPNNPVKPTPKPPTQTQSTATLKTGVENYGIAVAFALLAVVALAGAAIYVKKKETDVN